MRVAHVGFSKKVEHDTVVPLCCFVFTVLFLRVEGFGVVKLPKQLLEPWCVQ
jgi:hypothetical protein